MDKSVIKGWLKIVFMSLLISIALELTAFNFRFYQSLNNSPIHDIETEFVGLEDKGNGHYAVLSDEAYIEMKFPFQELENVHIDMQQDKPSGIYTNGVKVYLYVADEGNHFYYGMPEKLVILDIQTSQYHKLHCAGKAYQLKVVVDPNLAGTDIIIHDLSLNVKRPLYFSKYRVLFVWLLMLLVYVYRPKSEFYKYEYDLKKFWQKAVIICFTVIEIALLSFLVMQSHYSREPGSSPYVALARSLAKGQVYLDETPSEELVALDNPYDTDLRRAKEVDFAWDQAYYGGKYYVYFGVVPAIVFYLPYYLITGNDFTPQTDIYIMSALFVVGSLLLMHELIKRFFHKIPFILFVLTGAAFINGAGVLYLVLHPNHYTIPILMALVFAILGIYFWISAIDSHLHRMKRWRLFMGSLCIAAIAGCRPQIVLAGFLAFPIFIPYLVDGIRKEGMKSKYAVDIGVFLFPVVIVAALLMYYNYARFGSVLDFGANYNLTTNDMTKRGFVLERTGFGVFTLLFQPPAIMAQFPYVTETLLKTEYMGRTITESMYGGLIANNWILIFGLLFYKVKNQLKEKKLYVSVIMSLIFGFIITVADVQMAGILPRYISDFTVFFFVPALIVIYTLLEKNNTGTDRSRLYTLIVLLSVLSLIYNLLSVFAVGNIREDNVFYQKVSNLIQFWR